MIDLFNMVFCDNLNTGLFVKKRLLKVNEHGDMHAENIGIVVQ